MEDSQKKRDHLKEMLSKQVNERKMEKEKFKEYNKKMDQITLKNDRIAVEKAKKLQFEQHRRVQLQKVQRDVMLLEAQGRKMRDC